MNDFSEKNIRKRVVNEILQHPVSTLSLALGCVGFYVFSIKLITSPLFLGVATGIAGFGLGSFILNFIRWNKFESKYIGSLNSRIEKEKIEKIGRLRKKLEIFKGKEELSIYANQAQIQFDKVEEKFDSFKAMLSEKFNSNEITFGRFLGTSEQVYLAVLDNLEKTVHSLETMNSIDIGYIESRLDHLNGLSNPEAADVAEIKTMDKRKELHEKQRESVNILLTHNEEAMTEIDLSMSSIASADTIQERASVDLEFARNELVRLADRTKNFKT